MPHQETRRKTRERRTRRRMRKRRRTTSVERLDLYNFFFYNIFVHLKTVRYKL